MVDRESMGYCVKDARVERILIHIVDHREREREGGSECEGGRERVGARESDLR